LVEFFREPCILILSRVTALGGYSNAD
jgi:hypothetical protein